MIIIIDNEKTELINSVRNIYNTLKSTKRFSMNPVITEESDLEHSYIVALGSANISNILISKYNAKINQAKLLKMALIHDFDEMLVGDINHNAKMENLVKVDNVKLLKRMSDVFMFNEQEYVILYKEYKLGESIEAKIVKLCDWLSIIVYGYYEESLGNTNFAKIIDYSLENYNKIFKEIEYLINRRVP